MKTCEYINVDFFFAFISLLNFFNNVMQSTTHIG